jgi:hypothetical protein
MYCPFLIQMPVQGQVISEKHKRGMREAYFPNKVMGEFDLTLINGPQCKISHGT